MVHGKKRIPYWIDWRLPGLAGPEYHAVISFGLPIEPEDSQYGEYRLSCGVRRPTTTLHRTCTPARVRKTFKPTPARSNVTGAAYSTKTAPNTVGITEHKRQRLAGISHLGLLGLRISPMPAADASTSVAMLRRFISAVGRTSRETKRPTLTASASAPLPTSVNCSKCLINLANVIQPVQIYYGC